MTLQERILEKAKAVFFYQGIRSVSMDDLTEMLGISKRTLYQNFSSKDELLGKLLQDEYERFKMFFEKRINEDDTNIINILFDMIRYMKDLMDSISPLFLKDMEKYHSDIFVEYASKVKKESDKLIEEFFVLAQEQGYIRPEINPAIAHSVMDLIMRFQHDSMRNGKYLENEIVRSASYPFIRGVFTENGKKIINRLNKEMIFTSNCQKNSNHQVNEFIEI